MRRTAGAMMVALVLTYTCPCGATGEGVLVQTVRVNRNHLRSVGHGIGVMPPDCRCGHRFTPDQLTRVDIEGDDLDKVNTARVKKGWPAWDGRDLRVRHEDRELRACAGRETA